MPDRPMPRVGLIGFGAIAEKSHLPAWQSFAHVNIMAVADASEARLAAAAAALPNAALFRDPLDLMAKADVDIVDICTPPDSHMATIVAACDLGIPYVICEKPLVRTEQEYAAVARARARSGSRVVSINNWAYSQMNRAVLHALQTGMIGRPVRIDLHIGRPDIALGSDGWNPRWRSDPLHAGGGILMDHGWHQFYLMMGWMDQPLETVSARMRTVDKRHHGVEDEAEVELQFARGVARLELRWTAQGRTNGGIIQGERGSISIFDDHIKIHTIAQQHEIYFDAFVSQSSYGSDWFREVFSDTILACDRRKADRNFNEAGLVVAAIRAAYRSAGLDGVPCRPLLFQDDFPDVRPSKETAMTYGSGNGGTSAQRLAE